MALKNSSEISVIHDPEFINLQSLDVNPLMSECEVKVLYLGQNRNGSYIDKSAAMDMAKTLRGTPIVAAYYEEKDDFGDHGEVIHIENNEIEFSCKTVPYGFVSPDSQVWFQNYIDTDRFGNQVERTYLMTNGYLWTGQFPEITKVIREGQPQSMELDGETLDGEWATDNNLGIEFFIINDATFSKLCILGDNVEPCFEGAAVTAPQVSREFSKNKAFRDTLFAMREELIDALYKKGGSDMPNKNAETLFDVESAESNAVNAGTEAPANEAGVVSDNDVANDATVDSVETETIEEPVSELGDSDSSIGEDDVSAQDNVMDPEAEQADPPVSLDPQAEEDESMAESMSSFHPEDTGGSGPGLGGDGDDKDEDDPVAETPIDDDDADPEMRQRLLAAELQDEELSALRAEVEELREFKHQVELQQKHDLIDKKFNMLSAEDKADVIEHIETYTLDEIEAKLCIVYFNKSNELLSFNETVEEDAEDSADDPITTFSLEEETEVVPMFVTALRRAKESN